MDALTPLVALCLVPGIGGVTLRALLEHFGTLDAVLGAPAEALQAVPGIGPKIAAAIGEINLDRAAAEVAAWQSGGIDILSWGHPAYPARLRALRDAPPVLFCRGNAPALSQDAVSIVGTRQPGRESTVFAGRAAAELARRGWVIISGLAWGIDLAAHQGALRVDGCTVAVLGAGVNDALPPNKAALAQQVIVRGALLSEVHPAMRPSPNMLVARNRLISGLSRATVIVESGEQSGSLYAGRQAIKQGRALFVVQNGSAGNTALLEESAAVRQIPADFDDWDTLHNVLGSL